MSSANYYRLYSDSINKLKKITKLMFNEEKTIIKCGKRYYSECYVNEGSNDVINIPRHLLIGNTYLVRVYEYSWENIKTALYQDGVVVNSAHDYDEHFLENQKYTTYYDLGLSKLKNRLDEQAYSALLSIRGSNLYRDIITKISSEKYGGKIDEVINENYYYLVISKDLTMTVFQGIYL